jgi:hypothetical protein
MAPFKKGWSKKDKEVKAPEVKEEVVVTPALPIAKAFYIEKEKGIWRLVIADIQGDKVIARKIKECDNKAISLESFKIAFSTEYYFGK